MTHAPTQTWRREDGSFMARHKVERNDEVAHLVWVEGLPLAEIACQFGISAKRVSQIAWSKRYREMRRVALG